jgi:hypothetical protein
MDKPMERKGLSRLSAPPKMNSKVQGKPDPDKQKAGAVHGEKGEMASGGEEKTHTITEHADGSHTSTMHDGTETHHPDHLHMMAHLGHHITGGDAHHVMHHDGMSAKSHMIHEGGEHDGPHEHNTADEAKQSLDKFFGEEAKEPEHWGAGDGGGQMQETYGGM